MGRSKESQAVQEASEPAGVQTPASTQDPRIRVVVTDGSDAIREHVSQLLGRDCDVVAVCSDGRGMVGTVAALRPDVAVMDIAIAGASCLDTIRAIAETSPQTKVVVFSAYREQVCVRAARVAGARAYVFKSEPMMLLPSIMAVVRGECRFPDPA
jgi:DNA-binding NarL/FixJ family response regulator